MEPGRARRWRKVVLGGALLLACNKPGGATEGPAAEAEVGPPAGVRELAAPAKDEPGAAPERCPAGMVWIEGNEALEPFCMGETEVSVREFRRCVEAGKCREFDPKWDFLDETKATWLLGDETMPINFVDEGQAQQYCAFVGGRLPTAAEWIWAYGSAKGWSFPWGNELSDEVDRYCGHWQRPGQGLGEAVSCPAKQYPEDRTLQGVYDMAGSAHEIIGPNENGEYGVPLGVAPRAIAARDRSAIKATYEGKLKGWYAGPLVTRSHKTSIRCVAPASAAVRMD